MSIANKSNGSKQTDLSKFFDLVHEKQHVSLAQFPEAYALLNDIDTLFSRGGCALLAPQDMPFSFFLFRCHSSYRAACGAGLAGQRSEAFTLLRSCLELAAYALKMDKDPEERQIWLTQSSNARSQRAARHIFQMENICPAVAGADRRLGQILGILYFRTLKNGAHPSEMAIMNIGQDMGHRPASQRLLQKDGPALRHTLRSIAEVGLCSLLIFQKISVFTSHYERAGLDDELLELRKRVEVMFSPQS